MKDITIVVVDTFAHELARRAIDQTMQVLPCKEVLVLSDRNIYPDGQWVKINPITIEDYNAIMIKHLWPLVHTDHILVVQYDGMAVDASKWSDDFLNYDYIGAVWPWPHHPPEYKVGNGGFSLRSRRLLDMLKDERIQLNSRSARYEDLCIGVYHKDFLISQGICYPAVGVAEQFSHEHHPGYCSSFGFHGTFNVPYYLDDSAAEEFIRLMPGRGSEGSIMLIIHCYRAGRPALGQLALALARLEISNVDTVLKNILGKDSDLIELLEQYFHNLMIMC